MLELMGVTIERGPNPVVRDLDLAIRPGRVFWVVGPNGAGKSSLLRTLAGLDRPKAGRVVYPAGGCLYHHSEMAIPGSATTGDWRRLARRLSRDGDSPSPGLWPPVENRAVRRLSTGERKRLLLDVLLRRPGPLLLDEPFEHLSPDAKDILSDRLRVRARETVVVVATNQATHRAGLGGGLRLEAGTWEPLGVTSPASEPVRQEAGP